MNVYPGHAFPARNKFIFDKLFLSQLAEDAEGKGRRGRKRKNGELEEEEEDEGREVEREDRAKQREMMKEMRARRAAEKLVEAEFGDEVGKQRSRAKQVRKLLFQWLLTN